MWLSPLNVEYLPPMMPAVGWFLEVIFLTVGNCVPKLLNRLGVKIPEELVAAVNERLTFPVESV